jgi:hypothetical protein
MLVLFPVVAYYQGVFEEEENRKQRRKCVGRPKKQEIPSNQSCGST